MNIKDEPKVSIILVNYNGYKDTIECVESLKNIDYINYDIVIVDNDSTDNSYEILKKELTWCKLIRSSKNLGFAGGNNLGINYALDCGAKYILLLNNDTIVDENFLKIMLNTVENDDNIGIVTCKILYEKNRELIWYAGGYIDWFRFYGKHNGMKEKDEKVSNEQSSVEEITFASGCAMLIKDDVLKQVGLIPEDYFMYFEDVDFCVAAMDRGYKIAYNPNAVIYHKVSVASGGEDSPFSTRLLTKNRILFMNKYKHKVSKSTYMCSVMFFYCSRIVKVITYLLKGDIKGLKAMTNGIVEARKLLKNVTN